MKPPKLNKLSKKELRKLYSNQWNQNIIAVGENYNLNQALSVAEKQIQNYIEQSKERIEEKEKILEGIRKISNWNVTGFDHIKEGELILIMQSYFDEKMKEKEELEREKRLMKEATDLIVNWNDLPMQKGKEYVLVDRENYRNMIHKGNRGMLIEGENIRMKEDIEDWKEAVSRSRNLMNSYKELAERKNTEKNSIEKMARMAHKLDSGENLAWVSLTEDKKDMYRVLATRIVSEDPDKE